MAKTYQSKTFAFLVTMRPQHWVKNTFVCAPLLFSGQFTVLTSCLKTAVAFISFCVVSSAIYAINDLCDCREDKQHPIKRLRPIASGAVGPAMAVVLAVALIVFSLVLAWCLSWRLALIVLLYAVINIAYSLALKHVAIVDVMTIAAGFVLRILGGSVAISAAPSYWLVLCTMMISMFLGFTKRRAELCTLGSQLGNPRPVLKNYSVVFLDQAISMVTGATIIAYALYTVDAHTLKVLGTRTMLFTVPTVIYGLFRYIYIIYHLKEGDDPTETLIHDIPLIINLILWVVISLLVVNYGSQLKLF